MVEFNVIEASILEGWLFHPYGRTSRFGAKSPAPLYYRSSNAFEVTSTLMSERGFELTTIGFRARRLRPLGHSSTYSFSYSFDDAFKPKFI